MMPAGGGPGFARLHICAAASARWLRARGGETARSPRSARARPSACGGAARAWQQQKIAHPRLAPRAPPPSAAGARPAVARCARCCRCAFFGGGVSKAARRGRCQCLAEPRYAAWEFVAGLALVAIKCCVGKPGACHLKSGDIYGRHAALFFQSRKSNIQEARCSSPSGGIRPWPVRGGVPC